MENGPFSIREQKKIAWMSQRAALLPWRTVLENVSLVHQINQQPQSTHMMPSEELLKLVDLHEFSKAYPHTLSGGMQQRVALARTMAVGASLWLMDEPFAALDELTRESLTRRAALVVAKVSTNRFVGHAQFNRSGTSIR